jgi:hypothetical protein
LVPSDVAGAYQPPRSAIRDDSTTTDEIAQSISPAVTLPQSSSRCEERSVCVVEMSARDSRFSRPLRVTVHAQGLTVSGREGNPLARSGRALLTHFGGDRPGSNCHHFDHAFRCHLRRLANCHFLPRSSTPPHVREVPKSAAAATDARKLTQERANERRAKNGALSGDYQESKPVLTGFRDGPDARTRTCPRVRHPGQLRLSRIALTRGPRTVMSRHHSDVSGSRGTHRAIGTVTQDLSIRVQS